MIIIPWTRQGGIAGSFHKFLSIDRYPQNVFSVFPSPPLSLEQNLEFPRCKCSVWTYFLSSSKSILFPLPFLSFLFFSLRFSTRRRNDLIRVRKYDESNLPCLEGGPRSLQLSTNVSVLYLPLLTNISSNFFAVTVKENARSSGKSSDRSFRGMEWIGGRYSHSKEFAGKMTNV